MTDSIPDLIDGMRSLNEAVGMVNLGEYATDLPALAEWIAESRARESILREQLVTVNEAWDAEVDRVTQQAAIIRKIAEQADAWNYRTFANWVRDLTSTSTPPTTETEEQK